MKITIRKAKTAEDYNTAKKLFIEYASTLSFNLGFQNFKEELQNIMHEYSPPDGCILLAMAGNIAAGCVALRKFEPGISEMKRMYLKPGFRGKGIGKKLALAIIKEAKKTGYKKIRLDTLEEMPEAVALYQSLGFKKIKPYRHNPVKGAKFFELVLLKGNSKNSK